MKLNDAIDLFTGTYQKPTTRRTYAKLLDQFAQQIGPGRAIDAITHADIVAYHNHLLAQNYAAATLQQRVKGVKTFFNWLVKMEMLQHSPARILKARKPPRRQTRDKAMTDDELDLILSYVRFRSTRDYALVMFLADTGCRVAGAARLKTDDIDWDKREATVTEKGDKTRQVRFGQDTARQLRKHIIGRKHIQGPYVFSHDGRRVRPETLSQRIRRACYGLRKVGFDIRVLSAHSLRHRKGHQLADTRISPTIAATALGHDSVMTTLENYYPDDWDTAAQALDELSLKRKTD